MQTAATTSLWQFLNPVRLAGPIFDKELRVASRRVGSYGLRGGYLALLGILMLSAWYSAIGYAQRIGTAFAVSQGSVVAVAALLDIVVGALLLQRTRRVMRHHVF